MKTVNEILHERILPKEKEMLAQVFVKNRCIDTWSAAKKTKKGNYYIWFKYNGEKQETRRCRTESEAWEAAARMILTGREYA